MRQTIKQLEDAIDNLWELRVGDQSTIANLQRRIADHEVKGTENTKTISELKADKQRLWQLVSELAVAVRTHS